MPGTCQEARLADQESSGIFFFRLEFSCLHLPWWCWDHKHLPPCLACFIRVLGIDLRSLQLHTKHFTHRAISLVPWLNILRGEYRHSCSLLCPHSSWTFREGCLFVLLLELTDFCGCDLGQDPTPCILSLCPDRTQPYAS